MLQEFCHTGSYPHQQTQRNHYYSQQKQKQIKQMEKSILLHELQDICYTMSHLIEINYAKRNT